jgi:hypothetical protein
MSATILDKAKNSSIGLRIVKLITLWPVWVQLVTGVWLYGFLTAGKEDAFQVAPLELRDSLRQ